MKCPRCQADHDPGARFCEDCGARIELVCPSCTLVVHGTADLRIPFDDGRYLAAYIPEAQLYPFEGLGHLPIFTARREFCEALRRFVRTGQARPEAPAAPRG